MKVLLAILVLSTFIGCSRKPKIALMAESDAFDYLMDKYEKKKYLDAIDGFEFYVLNFSGSARVDSAQYMLGMSYFMNKQYVLSADAFDQLTRRYPNSQLMRSAMFKIGESYYKLSPSYHLDQEFTERAIEALQSFIDYYPDWREGVRDAERIIMECRIKLGEKMYASGRLYLKMKDWSSAEIYFVRTMDLFYDTEWASLSMYYLSTVKVKQNKFNEASENYRNFILKYPDHPFRSAAEKELTELNDLISKSTE